MRGEFVAAGGFTQPTDKAESPRSVACRAWGGHFCEDEDDTLGIDLAALNGEWSGNEPY